LNESAADISIGQILSQLLLVTVLIAINAFFVTVEFAVVVARRSRVDQIAAEGNAGARILQRWISTPRERDKFVAAVQLGITIVSLALGSQGEVTFSLLVNKLFVGVTVSPELSGLIRALPLVISLVIVSSFTVVFGEQVPKLAALRNPEAIAVLLAPIMRFFVALTQPLVWLLDRASSRVLRLFGLHVEGAHTSIYTVEELKQIVRESEQTGVLAETEREMLNSIFDIRELVTRQVMIPRTEMKMIDADARFDELVKLATTSPHTKFPVYEEDADHVIGVLYVKDLIKALSNPREQRTIRSLTREVLLVPDTLSVEDLLARFRGRRQQIAIVLDEFGGTAGLVTLEDIIEEIIGDLTDQFEAPSRPDVQRLKNGSASITGLMKISEFNDEFESHLVDSNYDTIGGYIMGRLERIAAVGDSVALENGMLLRVEAMDGMRIERISLLPPPAKGAPAVKPNTVPVRS